MADHTSPMAAALPPVTPTGAGDILGRTATGAGWIVAWRMATRLLGFANTLILARLLLPADFGLVALGSSFVISLDSLSMLGVEDSLVREQTPSRTLYDTGFTLNLIRAGLTSALLLVAAYPLGRFFNEPRLANVLLALAVGTLATGLTNIGTVEFRRHLSFDREFRMLVLPRLTGVIVTVGVALALHSYWALIAGILTGRLLGVVLSYVMHPYRPRITLKAWRQLAGFSGWSWAIGIAALVRDRTDAFFIGWSLNAGQVGIYSIGVEIADLPTTELVGPLGRACFSGFTAARHHGQDAGQTYLRVVGAVTLLTFPIAIGISLLADPMVHLAFGARWMEAVPVIQLTSLFCATTVFGQISYNLFSAHAMLQLMFVITAATGVLRVLLLVVLVPRLGILGAVLAAGIPMLCEYSWFVALTLRRFGLGLSELIARVWRPLAATAVMAACLRAIGFGWVESTEDPTLLALHIFGGAALGVVIYAASLVGCWLALGKPPGAEADVLSLADRLLVGQLRKLTSAS